MSIFKKLLFLLNPYERKSSVLLLILILIMALLEMIGIASILPFMAVLTNPAIIETNVILKTMYEFLSPFGVESKQDFLFSLGIIVFILLIVSLTFKAITNYAQVRFVEMREFSLGKRLIEGYLCQPYSWFLSRHSSDLGKNILSEINTIVSNGISPMIELIANSIVAITLITLLIIVDTKIALIVSISLGGAYCFIFYVVRKYLDKIGKERLKNNQLRFMSVNEVFAAVKEVKVGGTEQTYIKNFSNSAQVFAKTMASSQVISKLPRFILEAITFGGALLIIFYIMAQTRNLSNAIPIVSLYVFSGYRLMPALQKIYVSFTKLTFVGPALDKLYSDIISLKSVNTIEDQGSLYLQKKIQLKNICYSYPNSSRTALKNIDLVIPVKSTIGLVGTTGSGKTTLVDIILGLLEAQKGTLEIDGKIINKKNVRSWQKTIGYVPQHIYLSDGTVASNIAFGLKPKNINYEIIERVSKIANLHNFVINELPQQYQTTIGERGVRLSGGQRQRIGIARALYLNPQVLVLDEATSALDGQTEKVVMDAINNLSKDITIILIAHRLNTVKNCDTIFKLQNGQVIAQGNFEDLMIKTN